MSEVIKNNEELLFINSEFVENIKYEARQSPRQIARLLMHISHEDMVQEMLIAMGRECLVTPNQSVGRSESLLVIEGEVLIVIFDNSGEVSQKQVMGSPESKKPFLYRFNNTPWHTMIPLTEMVLVHETLQGPFEESSQPLPEWVPTETSLLKDFLQDIKY